MKISGYSACDEYLSIIDEHQLIAIKMKELEEKIAAFNYVIDCNDHKKIIDRFRRHCIKLRRSYSRSREILSEVAHIAKKR